MISQHFYFITAPFLFAGASRLPKINQSLVNKTWQQLGFFPHFGRLQKSSPWLSESPVPGAVENNLPMLIGRRNVTEWRTENFFPKVLLTSEEHKAQRPFGHCAESTKQQFVMFL